MGYRQHSLSPLLRLIPGHTQKNPPMLNQQTVNNQQEDPVKCPYINHLFHLGPHAGSLFTSARGPSLLCGFYPVAPGFFISRPLNQQRQILIFVKKNAVDVRFYLSYPGFRLKIQGKGLFGPRAPGPQHVLFYFKVRFSVALFLWSYYKIVRPTGVLAYI